MEALASQFVMALGGGESLSPGVVWGSKKGSLSWGDL